MKKETALDASQTKITLQGPGGQALDFAPTALPPEAEERSPGDVWGVLLEKPPLYFLGGLLTGALLIHLLRRR